MLIPRGTNTPRPSETPFEAPPVNRVVLEGLQVIAWLGQCTKGLNWQVRDVRHHLTGFGVDSRPHQDDRASPA